MPYFYHSFAGADSLPCEVVLIKSHFRCNLAELCGTDWIFPGTCWRLHCWAQCNSFQRFEIDFSSPRFKCEGLMWHKSHINAQDSVAPKSRRMHALLVMKTSGGSRSLLKEFTVVCENKSGTGQITSRHFVWRDKLLPGFKSELIWSASKTNDRVWLRKGNDHKTSAADRHLLKRAENKTTFFCCLLTDFCQENWINSLNMAESTVELSWFLSTDNVLFMRT